MASGAGFLASCLAILLFAPVSAQDSVLRYPIIRRLEASDLVFRQFTDSAAQGRRAEAGTAPWPDLVMAYWRAEVPTDVFSLAARFDLPYETLATANRLSGQEAIGAGRLVLIPSVPGIFVAETPANDLEHLVSAGRAEEPDAGIPVELALPSGAARFRFIPGARFNPSERAFFLNIQFRFPLPKGRLTSAFGPRASPFTGKPAMHAGIDLAAPAGTPVYAARAGTVVEAGFHPIYGEYLVIEHEGRWSTLYGHLSKRVAALRDVVSSGSIIGEVGSTGQSTGPHLHFEVRLGGAARDPLPVLPRNP
ncbi:MAG: M23 family metallopeptidase [Spirochaetales bacterium]|nr:M23 family metallopeptidase [Spirochaetales bacterium]